MSTQTPTAYIPVPISDPPKENGFYFTLMGERTGNSWFKEGRWLDEILNGIPTEVTHWLKPIDLSRMLEWTWHRFIPDGQNPDTWFDRNSGQPFTTSQLLEKYLLTLENK